MNSKLDKLRKTVLSCTKCQLAEGRENAVFGNGDPDAEIMLIAEAPGFYENKSGEVFQGNSGKLLDKILAACGFTRDEHIYISNIVKCKPPKNRVPTEAEKNACLPHLEKQLKLINPKILVLLGATALRGLIDPKASITKMRGEWLEWQGRWVMPTYHPAALLRSKSLKLPAWQDFQKIVAKYRELVDANHHSDYC